MSDDIIRNPKRKKMADFYEPEYVRLKKFPNIMTFNVPMPKKRKKYMQQEDVFEIPPQMKVHSGNNSNWTEISSEENSSKNIEENRLLPETKKEFSLNQEDVSDIYGISPGEYCITIKNSMIASSFDKNEMINLIEDLFFKENNSNIELSDISLWKKFPLKIGIIAE